METPEAILLIAAVVLLFVAVFFVARNEIVKRRLTCPRSGTDADVEVKQRYEGDGKPLRVKSCSMFPDPRQVDCEEDCIKS